MDRIKAPSPEHTRDTKLVSAKSRYLSTTRLSVSKKEFREPRDAEGL